MTDDQRMRQWRSGGSGGRTQRGSASGFSLSDRQAIVKGRSLRSTFRVTSLKNDGRADSEKRIAMPSPFPGMDPYLENPEIFPDFHDSVITYLREALQASLPAPYFAALGRRVWIEVSRRSVGPDVQIQRAATWHVFTSSSSLPRFGHREPADRASRHGQGHP